MTTTTTTTTGSTQRNTATTTATANQTKPRVINLINGQDEEGEGALKTRQEIEGERGQ